MCTAIAYANCFGRNLDLECSYGEKVVITPRNFPLHMQKKPTLTHHYAIIGMAAIANNYPLYYDGTNEHGLSMAALNFPGNAHYFPEKGGFDNITPFELIPWILSQCRNLEEAKILLGRLNLTDSPFSPELPLTPLHWILSDNENSLTIESTKEGLFVHPNPIGILTNNPPFPYHMQNLCNYKGLSAKDAQNNFSSSLSLESYSRGMGAMGLPGDFSSASRFVRAAFVKLNSHPDPGTNGIISQFFHILDSVAMVQGTVIHKELFETTVYSSCCDTKNLIYYYTTYHNRQITGVPMTETQMQGDTLFIYPLIKTQQIRMIDSSPHL